MTESSVSRLHAVVEGRVQGVGFRYFVVEKAQSLGLTGWVRNRWNDTVEVLAEGEREELEGLVRHLHRGPPSAYVTDVKTDWEEPQEKFAGFHVRPTA